jgi:tetratricopeptide (TPR) repeat protein
LAGFIFLSVAFVSALKNKREPSDFFRVLPFLSASTAVFLTSWLLVPAGVATAAALFASLGMVASASQNGGRLVVEWPEMSMQIKGKTTQKRPFPAGLVVLGKILGMGLILLPLGKYLLGDFYYNQAIKAQQVGDGDQALRAVNQAIRLNPSRDEYSLGAATINLALASTLSRQPEATQAGSQTSQLINSFVTVALNQAQRATALVPLRSSNWQNLAEVYRNLLTYSANAGTNAVAAYQQAIQLDPLNPFLSINLGNLLLSLEQHQEAVTIFQNAIRIRTDLPAAHLGLARALRLSGDLENSKRTYEELLAFNFDPQADIYQTIKEEYEEVKAEIQSQSEEVEKNLTKL